MGCALSSGRTLDLTPPLPTLRRTRRPSTSSSPTTPCARTWALLPALRLLISTMSPLVIVSCLPLVADFTRLVPLTRSQPTTRRLRSRRPSHRRSSPPPRTRCTLLDVDPRHTLSVLDVDSVTMLLVSASASRDTRRQRARSSRRSPLKYS